MRIVVNGKEYTYGELLMIPGDRFISMNLSVDSVAKEVQMTGQAGWFDRKPVYYKDFKKRDV